MKKILTIFILAVVLTSSAPLFAADSKNAASTAATAGQPKKTVFNNLSNFLSGFDRPFKRPGNKEGFWNATASWVRNINKN